MYLSISLATLPVLHSRFFSEQNSYEMYVLEIFDLHKLEFSEGGLTIFWSAEIINILLVWKISFANKLIPYSEN